MHRFYLVAALLFLGECRSAQDAPKSLCDLPRSFKGSENTPVRWQGVIVGGMPHGFALASEECPRRGIKLAGWATDTPEGTAFEKAVYSNETGLLRVDVSGNITQDRTLWVSKVHKLAFQPMTDDEYWEYWRSRSL